MLSVFGAAAGASGSPLALVSTSKAVNTTTGYIINDTNFPGIGKYLPGYVYIIGATPANVNMQISVDNGTNWLAAATGVGAGFYADAGGSTGVGQGVSTVATVRLHVANATTVVHIFVARD